MHPKQAVQMQETCQSQKGMMLAALFVASNVPKQDVPTTNGVLHILDQVVTPKLWRFPERNFMQFANKADQPGQRDKGLWSGTSMHFTHDMEKILKFKSESVGHRIFDDIIAFSSCALICCPSMP